MKGSERTLVGTAEQVDAPGDDAPAAPRLGYRPALDGMRGIAVVLVVLVHSGNSLWPEAKAWLAPGGPLGVHLFFVLSGFLITTLLLAEHERHGGIDLGRFAWRRARRLVPVVAALLAVLAVVAAAGTYLEVKQVVSTAAHVGTFTSNWAINGHPLPVVEWLGGNPGPVTETLHTWSLSIEVQFYVLWACGLWAATRAGWSHRRLAVATTLIIAVVALARAVMYARGTHWLTLYFETWSRLDAPLVGALAGIAFTAGWLTRPPRRLAVAGAAGLALFVATAFLTDWSLNALPLGLYTVLAACGALAIAAVVAVPEGGLARALSWRPLVALGIISYSLYVWHYALFWTIERHDPALPGPVRFVGGVGLALAAAGASYLLVERPFLGRRRSRPAERP